MKHENERYNYLLTTFPILSICRKSISSAIKDIDEKYDMYHLRILAWVGIYGSGQMFKTVLTQKSFETADTEKQLH